MLKNILPILFLIVLNSLSLNLLSQEFKVHTTSIEVVDNKLVVKYDIENSTESQSFNVMLEISSSARSIISTNSLTGDIGEGVKGGPNKQIIWDYLADRIVLQDNINIIVTAKLMKTQASLSKVLLLSAVCPGAGLSSVQKGKPYWLMGIVGYAGLGASYLLNKKAKNSYDSYVNNKDESLNDGLLADARSQDKLSKTMAISSIGIWGVGLIWTALKAGNGKQKSITMLNRQRLFFYSGVNPYTKTAGFTLKYRF